MIVPLSQTPFLFSAKGYRAPRKAVRPVCAVWDESKARAEKLVAQLAEYKTADEDRVNRWFKQLIATIQPSSTTIVKRREWKPDADVVE